jgi:hypothetical protein
VLGRLSRAAILVALVWPCAAEAEEPALRACSDAYEQGQRLRRRGELRAARKEFVECGRDVCPTRLSRDCIAWLGDLERALPSVVLIAREAGGRDVREVRVLIDGEPTASELDGRAVPVDPGEHTFRFEPKGGPPAEMRVLVFEGEKSRPIVATLEPAAPPPQGAHDKPPPGPASRPEPAPPKWPIVALGVVGVVALGTFTYFGLSGVSARNDLEKCRGSCPDGDVDAVQRKFIIADVSLGISVVSLAAAALVGIVRAGSVKTQAR